MESTGIVIKETIRNQYKSRKKISKLSFEEIILKSTLYLFVPHCVPLPLLALLTSLFKTFNRNTFTTYDIKKTAENFTLNRVLLMLNAYFCFNKNFFIDLLRLLQFFRH